MALHGRTGSGRERPAGFSLTELLVVVSIICLMMSLLLPILTRAQRQGEQTHCLGNQHQLGLAWMQFAVEHDDQLCRPPTFPSELQPYVQDEEILQCKSAAKDDRKAVTRNHSRGVVWSLSEWRSYGLAAEMGGGSRDGVKGYSTLHSIPHPVDRLVFVDIEPGRFSEGFWPIMQNRGQWTWRPWSWPVSMQNITGRHNDGCNMTFADGHGDYTHWKDARTRKLIKGLIADPNQASVDNPDLKYVISGLAGK